MGYERASQDLNRILNAEFSENIIISTPEKVQLGLDIYGSVIYGNRKNSIQIKGLVSKHRISINPSNGLPINSDNIHCSVYEQNLIDLNYVTRNDKNEVNLLKHIVNFSGSNYVINETWPDSMLGIIVCILGKYNGI